MGKEQRTFERFVMIPRKSGERGRAEMWQMWAAELEVEGVEERRGRIGEGGNRLVLVITG